MRTCQHSITHHAELGLAQHPVQDAARFDRLHEIARRRQPAWQGLACAGLACITTPAAVAS
ncbi:MAG: hypothetical protein HS113_24165 [Verrucomicrobiales bacterium]|nr:hypothetical protein [Verrucomicrobiales bacterium]